MIGSRIAIIILKKHELCLLGGAVVKGAVLQRQLCHQRLWVRAQALSQPVMTGRSVGRRTIGTASSGLGRAWPVGISLTHRAPATPVAGRGQCTLTKVARCTVFPPTHWCGWLPVWMRAVLRSSAAWLCIGGLITFNLRLSRARTGVVAIRHDSGLDWIP